MPGYLRRKCTNCRIHFQYQLRLLLLQLWHTHNRWNGRPDRCHAWQLLSGSSWSGSVSMCCSGTWCSWLVWSRQRCCWMTCITYVRRERKFLQCSFWRIFVLPTRIFATDKKTRDCVCKAIPQQLNLRTKKNFVKPMHYNSVAFIFSRVSGSSNRNLCFPTRHFQCLWNHPIERGVEIKATLL